MNHLCGAFDGDTVKEMALEAEIEPLAAFRASYYAHADADPSAVPTWEMDPSMLPDSGWRALDDVTLLRFLRADKRKGEFQPQVSLARLLKALQWRKRMCSDALLSEPADEHYELLRIRRWVGFDNSGRPVQFERLGQFLGSANASAYTGEVWLRHYARDLETTFEQLRTAGKLSGKPITTYLYCADFQGGGGIMWHLGTVIPLLKLLTKEVEAHFPEMVREPAQARSQKHSGLLHTRTHTHTHSTHARTHACARARAHAPPLRAATSSDGLAECYPCGVQVGNIVIFNAPRIFASVFPMVKAFMDPITAAKVEVHSNVPTERLRALMPAEAIPVEYGGSSTAPFPVTRIHAQHREAASGTAAPAPTTTSEPAVHVD